MTLLLVLLLLVLWGAVFLPALLRTKHDSSPLSTVSSFRRGMRALSRNSAPRHGRYVLVPAPLPPDPEASRTRVIETRKRVFVSLLFAAAATLLIGLLSVMGLLPDMRGVLRVHLLIDMVLVGYVLYLIQAKQRSYMPKHSFEVSPEEDDLLQASQF